MRKYKRTTRSRSLQLWIIGLISSVLLTGFTKYSEKFDVKKILAVFESNEESDNSSDLVISEDMSLCMPSPIAGEQILYRKAYVVSYNPSTKNPNWVAWHLTAEHADGDIPRQKDFIEDTSVSEPRATLADYRGSGYDRGHMCPAGDNKWDSEAMYESFYLTNMCPQNSSLNSGVWNKIEMDCRAWAKRYGDIYIVCGPIYLNKVHETIGENNVFVPEAFFKVVLCLNGKPKGIGIIARNGAGQSKRDLYYNSIDQIEKITGYDFFPSLPDDFENIVESEYNLFDWKI